ncbi:MAG: lipopolysaccharide core heptose(II) kinase RfaY [Candidatus Wallbacteria bacterium]
MIFKNGLIAKTYRHANRYGEIISIIMKHGFSDLIERAGIDKLPGLNKKELNKNSDEASSRETIWSRIRKVFEELGPTFIKLGQMLSNRPHLIPNELLNELEKLQNSVPMFPAEDAINIIEKELSQPLSNLFADFSMEPIGAASIAQVHKATLHNGKNVIIKVQRPGIKRIIDIDIEIIKDIAAILENYEPEFKKFNFNNIIHEFEKNILKELNFLFEAANMEKFKLNFDKCPGIYVPECHKEYSTQSILVMEFIDGVKISDIEEIKNRGLSPEIIADNGAKLILKQIFKHGFFHADPHPGNIMVLNDNVICFLDYGMMGLLTRSTREFFSSILIDLAGGDARQIAKTLAAFSSGYDNDLNMSNLEMQITELIETHFYQSLNHMDIGTILNDLIKIFTENNLKMPPDFYLLLRSLAMFQANGEKLNKNFQISEHIKPYARQILKARYSPVKFLREIYSSGIETASLIKDLPLEIKYLINKLKHGKIKIDIEHGKIEQLLTTHERTANKIAFSVVLASLIIGSSIVVHSKIPPLWNEVPLIGIGGFLFASILGFWLLISILRHEKL